MRICSRCGCEDQVVIREGQQDFAGREITEHKVTVDLKYIKDRKEITPYLKSRGWSFREHLGRQAMVRFTCRDCLNDSAIVGRDFRRKQQAETRAVNIDSYYLNLCEGS